MADNVTSTTPSDCRCVFVSKPETSIAGCSEGQMTEEESDVGKQKKHEDVTENTAIIAMLTRGRRNEWQKKVNECLNEEGKETTDTVSSTFFDLYKEYSLRMQHPQLRAAMIKYNGWNTD